MLLASDKDEHMNRNGRAFLKRLEPLGTLAAALALFFLALVLLLARLHDFGWLAFFMADLLILFGCFYVWAYLSHRH